MLWKCSPEHASSRTDPMWDILLHGRVSGTGQGRFDIIYAWKRWRFPTLDKNILSTENLEISRRSTILHFQEHTSILYRIYNRWMFFIFSFFDFLCKFKIFRERGSVEKWLIFFIHLMILIRNMFRVTFHQGSDPDIRASSEDTTLTSTPTPTQATTSTQTTTASTTTTIKWNWF